MIVLMNGERVDCGDALTVAEVIRRHQLPPETTLVEHNGSALRRGEWSKPLQENDRLEILRVAAGG